MRRTEPHDSRVPPWIGAPPRRGARCTYVVHTLQTALHDATRADDAEAAIVTAVDRGGDTDTIGAVTGAVAGARFGASELPDRWLAELDEESELRTLARDLAALEGN